MMLPTATVLRSSGCRLPPRLAAADRGREVAVETLDGLDLRLQEQVDLGVLHDARDALCEQVVRGVEIGGSEIDSRQVAAEVIAALDEVDGVAGVGQLERGRHAGDAAADDERRRTHVHFELLERFVEDDAAHGRFGERHGLLGGCGMILVHPRALLADVGHLQEVLVDAGPLQRLAERRLVHARAAGGDDDTVERVLCDVLDDHLLTGVGAHVLVRFRHDDSGQRCCVCLQGIAVDDVGYVRAAVADVHADPWFVHFRLPHAACGSPAGSSALLSRVLPRRRP